MDHSKVHQHSIRNNFLRLAMAWLGFAGLLSQSVCPFCGSHGCPVGAASAGIGGGALAFCFQYWSKVWNYIKFKLKGSKMKVHDITLLRHFSHQGPVKKVFLESEGVSAEVICLKAGQSIPACETQCNTVLYIIAGAGEISADNQWAAVKPGEAVTIPKDAQRRSIRAEQDMVILAIKAE